jgi:hypothetical protein
LLSSSAGSKDRISFAIFGEAQSGHAFFLMIGWKMKDGSASSIDYDVA